MRSRELIAAIGTAAVASPLRVLAQQPRPRVIGLLSPFTREETEPWHSAFRQGLGELTNFQLVVNSKTAEAIGLKLTPNFLIRADAVVE